MRGAAASTGGAVRIIGGRWRGTRLPVTDIVGLRPTADRVRETLFNWLEHARPAGLHDARVLDLFAGSGALGLEAVSRGAREAFLVERDPKQLQALQSSLQRLDAGHSVHLVRADALAWLRAPLHGRFDLVFVDPPFRDGLWTQVLEQLQPWLAQDAWLYLEAPVSSSPSPGATWALHREGRTREVHYALYRSVRPGAGAATLAHDPLADGVPSTS
jgi:16S rRNA (guanine966-N2)-methyltransferase